MNNEIMQALFDAQQEAFQREAYVDYGTRIDRLNRCIALLVDQQDNICDAINNDFGNRSHHVTLMMDIYMSVNAAKFVKKHLKKWMKPHRRKVMTPLNLFGSRAHVYYEPKGVVGLMTPWNVPINMIFTPLVDILGAGNRCMIKPSEFTPETSALIDELFARYFDATEIAVVNGGSRIGASFAKLPFDHLIFTGSTQVGQKIMKSAAENLTPVTLELGGKSPVIVSKQVKLEDAMSKLATGKCMNAGQLCIAPDYAFIPEHLLEPAILHIQQTIKKQYPSLLKNRDWVSMINTTHYQRINSYIKDAEKKGARIIEVNPADENWRNTNGNKIPLHLVINPSDDMLVMQDEMFGPVLSLKTYRDIQEPISYIRKHDKPLALYYFGSNSSEQEKVLREVSAGGVTINDIASHVSCDDMPFGGIGKSGMGNYHGFDGFRTFSHAKSVFKQGFVNLPKLAGTLPPYTSNVDKLMEQQIRK